MERTSPLRAVAWRLWVAYDGTHYSGWQQQDGAPSVQAALQEALKKVTGQDIVVNCAGRTDAGVHARAQAVSCAFESRFDTRKLILALATVLPPDISVWRADEVPQPFDAKRHAVGKRYLYRVSQSFAKNPFNHRTCWQVRGSIDVNAMQKAAPQLVGDLDYESFRAANCSASHARRTIWHFDVRRDHESILFDVRGNAFCQHMVRIMVGTLIDVGQGRIAPHDIVRILEAKDRTAAGQTAPPQGLTLDEVYYPDDLSNARIPDGVKFPRYPVTDASWGFKVGEIVRGATSCLALESANY